MVWWHHPLPTIAPSCAAAAAGPLPLPEWQTPSAAFAPSFTPTRCHAWSCICSEMVGGMQANLNLGRPRRPRRHSPSLHIWLFPPQAGWQANVLGFKLSPSLTVHVRPDEQAGASEEEGGLLVEVVGTDFTGAGEVALNQLTDLTSTNRVREKPAELASRLCPLVGAGCTGGAGLPPSARAGCTWDVVKRTPS